MSILKSRFIFYLKLMAKGWWSLFMVLNGVWGWNFVEFVVKMEELCSFEDWFFLMFLSLFILFLEKKIKNKYNLIQKSSSQSWSSVSGSTCKNFKNYFLKKNKNKFSCDTMSTTNSVVSSSQQLSHQQQAQH